jgi:NACHT domain
MQILIAHAEGEEQVAERIAKPLREAGYEVAHRGTVLVGESVVEDASKVLQRGAPVVLCGTIKALGTGWAHKLVNVARAQSARVYPLQIERDAYIQQLALDERALSYWQDPAAAISGLLSALACHYPVGAETDGRARAAQAEERYRALALEACDIIDLANLPEMDRNVATRELELRRLYVALRVHVERRDGEVGGGHDSDDGIDDGARGRGGELDESLLPTQPVPVGLRLARARRLVVLGDPGAGKTTLLRWIATAYLLRLKDDPDVKHLPDVATLPQREWLPLMVRCRELSPSMTAGSLDDIVVATLKNAELSQADVQAMRELLRSKLAAGEALLLVDGLDEIADTKARVRFCRKLEDIRIAHPETPVVVTSRIVGYREMNYRIDRGFEHVTVADLSHEDKDDFATRWCAVTETKARRAVATAELIRDIHSTDRIERLTGNPMLLTTMALVKRKVGKLPNRRADLYWDAVEVLLNWRGEVDDPIDHHEAIPQLEYIAYTMCRRGEQQLREDEIVTLLERMREEYPKVHAIHRRSPHEFLHELERRTGILVESGYVRHRGRPAAVFEFRHLTFQEYLAGRALVDGRHPERDRSQSLAERVAPLAALDNRPLMVQADLVGGAWDEALRLCVTSCNDDDVDEVLQAIVRPLAVHTRDMDAPHRALLAVQCLADEPNAGAETATEILERFVDATTSLKVSERSGGGLAETLADELCRSRWAGQFRRLMVRRFIEQAPEQRGESAALVAPGNELAAAESAAARNEWFERRTRELRGRDQLDRCVAALRLMRAASTSFRRSPGELGIRPRVASDAVQALVEMLDGAEACRHAASLALLWLIQGRDNGNVSRKWQLNAGQIKLVVAYLERELYDEPVTRYLFAALGQSNATEAVAIAARYTLHPTLSTATSAARALTQIDSTAAIEELRRIVEGGDEYAQPVARTAIDGLRDTTGALRRRVIGVSLRSPHRTVRNVAVAMSVAKASSFDRKLMSFDLDGANPFLDPTAKITDARVRSAAKRLGKTPQSVRAAYEQLAGPLGLRLSWQAASERAKPPRDRSKAA